MFKNIALTIIALCSLSFGQFFVVVRGETLFSANDYASATSAQKFLDSMLATGKASADSIFVEKSGDSLWGISYGESVFIWLKEMPCSTSNLFMDCRKIESLFNNPAKSVGKLSKFEFWNTSGLFRLGTALIAPLIFIIFVAIIIKIKRKITRYLIEREKKLIDGVKIGRFTIIPAKEEISTLIHVVAWIRTITIVGMFFLLTFFLLYLYPATKPVGILFLNGFLKMMTKIGLIMLVTIGLAIAGVIIVFFAKLAIKLSEILIRNYQTKDRSRLPLETLTPIGTFIKIAIVILFTLLFFTLIPGPGDNFSIVGFFIFISIIGISTVPIFIKYLYGYLMIFHRVVKIGYRVSYHDKYWLVDNVTPLFVYLSQTETGEFAVVPAEDFLKGGIVYMKPKTDETESNSNKGG
jgi:hypothetical protein